MYNPNATFTKKSPDKPFKKFDSTKKSSGKTWWDGLSETEKKDYLEKKELKMKGLEEKEKEFEGKFKSLFDNITKLSLKEVDDLFAISRKFDNFSFKNTYLILLQNGNASSVAGNSEWFKNGYKLKKGAEGMFIFIPCRKKIFEKEIAMEDFKNIGLDLLGLKYGIKGNMDMKNFHERGGKMFYAIHIDTFKLSDYKVYDISEVEERLDENGKSLAKRLNNMTTRSQTSFKDLSDIVKNKFGIDIQYESSSVKKGGFVIHGNTKEIFLNRNLDELNNIGTLVHELSHIQLGHVDEDHTQSYIDSPTYDILRGLKELEAESLTYLLCQDLGIERKSEYYLRSWKENTAIGDEMYKKIFLKVCSTYDKMRKKIFLDDTLSNNDSDNNDNTPIDNSEEVDSSL